MGAGKVSAPLIKSLNVKRLNIKPSNFNLDYQIPFYPMHFQI